MTPKQQSVPLPKGQAASSTGPSSKRGRRRRQAAVEVEANTDSGEEEGEESAASQSRGNTGRRQRGLQDSSFGTDPELTLSPVHGKRGRKRHSDQGEGVPIGGESEAEVAAPLSAKTRKKKSEASEKENTSLTVKIRLTGQLKNAREKGQTTPSKEGTKKKPQGADGLGEFLMSIHDTVLSKQVGEVQGALHVWTGWCCSAKELSNLKQNFSHGVRDGTYVCMNVCVLLTTFCLLLRTQTAVFSVTSSWSAPRASCIQSTTWS